MKRGVLVISLDFEMMWGAKDWSTPEEYGKSNVAQVPQVINRLLKLFSKYDVHATFATVGFIFCRDKDELLAKVPIVKPSYIDKNLSPYSDNYIENIAKGQEHLYFAPGLIKKIVNTRGMELATHTACHYNCSARGQTLEEFEADLVMAKQLANENNCSIQSIVFPRNQVSDAYLDVCDRHNISIYRGNSKRYFSINGNRFERIRDRLCRLLDNYIPLDNSTTYPITNVIQDNRFNVRASRFLRPYSSLLSYFDGLKCRRIKGEITKAAKKCEIYHIWWHPHNFGANTDKNLELLENLLKHYKYCQQKYGMKSMNMMEVAQLARNNG